MISGRFGEIGELFFEIEVVAAAGEAFPIEVLLDTGFTIGWLAMDIQDIQSLRWSLLRERQAIAVFTRLKYNFYIPSCLLPSAFCLKLRTLYLGDMKSAICRQLEEKSFLACMQAQ